MPNYNFDFETTANADGNILVEDQFDIPISVKIKDFSVETTANCNNRSHKVVVSIDDDGIIDKLVNDCNDLIEDLDISIAAGHKKIKLYYDGFDQNEIVTGKGKVNYSISLFPFGLTATTGENVNNLEDPLISSTKQIIKNKIKSLTNFTIIKS